MKIELNTVDETGTGITFKTSLLKEAIIGVVDLKNAGEVKPKSSNTIILFSGGGKPAFVVESYADVVTKVFGA